MTWAYVRFARYGVYVARRLTQANKAELAQIARTNAQAVLSAGRAWEDSGLGLTEQLAARNATDDALDEATRDARRVLGARSADAAKTSPYTDIFHRGVAYYTAAPIAEQARRTRELIERLERFLDEDDPVRVDAVPRLRAGIEAFETARGDVEQQRIQVGLLATAQTKAKEDFVRAMQRVYGLLIADDAVGMRRAETFFPKLRRSPSSAPVDAPDDFDGEV